MGSSTRPRSSAALWRTLPPLRAPSLPLTSWSLRSRTRTPMLRPRQGWGATKKSPHRGGPAHLRAASGWSTAAPDAESYETSGVPAVKSNNLNNILIKKHLGPKKKKKKKKKKPPQKKKKKKKKKKS